MTVELPGLLPFRWEANDGPITPRPPVGDVELGAVGAVTAGTRVGDRVTRSGRNHPYATSNWSRGILVRPSTGEAFRLSQVVDDGDAPEERLHRQRQCGVTRLNSPTAADWGALINHVWTNRTVTRELGLSNGLADGAVAS
jgi:hypothetical protein